jgi:DNA invertase Pin-like site-specific DNA recombinase
MARRTIDEQTYYCVKRMLKLGKRTDEIAEASGVSVGTVRRVDLTNDYKDYIAQVKRRSAEIMQKRKEKLEQQPAQPIPFIEPPKATTKDLRQIILNKIDELVGEIGIYKSTRQGGSKEARAAAMARIKLEEAQMWLKSNI